MTRTPRSRNFGGCMADWKLPHHLQDTASVVLHNWIMRVHGPHFTRDYEEARSDKASENYPDYMTKRDQPDRRTR